MTPLSEPAPTLQEFLQLLEDYLRQMPLKHFAGRPEALVCHICTFHRRLGDVSGHLPELEQAFLAEVRAPSLDWPQSVEVTPLTDGQYNFRLA